MLKIWSCLGDLVLLNIINVIIKYLCSSRVYKHMLKIWSCLGDLVRCILSLNFGAQELYI